MTSFTLTTTNPTSIYRFILIDNTLSINEIIYLNDNCDMYSDYILKKGYKEVSLYKVEQLRTNKPLSISEKLNLITQHIDTIKQTCLI